AAVPPSHPPSPLDASQPEISLDFVEESIKKLADALNTAAASGRAEPAPESASPNEADVDRSIAALRTAARTMKAPAGRPAAPAAPAPDAAPPLPDRRAEWWPAMDAKRVTPAQATGAPPVNPRLARLTEAVA